jgi:Nucleotide modification associated domain 5
MRLNKWDKQSIVKAIMADVPKPNKDKRRKDLQDAVVKLMSPECRKVFKSTPTALATYHVGDLISSWGYESRKIVCGDVSEKQIKTLIQKYWDEEKVIDDAQRNLASAVEACTSLKQLNDRLPEFKKYFPTEEKPVANLPAIANVVADLSKLGWPKGTNK